MKTVEKKMEKPFKPYFFVGNGAFFIDKEVFFQYNNKVSKKNAVAFSRRNKSRLYFGVLKRRLFSFAHRSVLSANFLRKNLSF